MKVIQTAREPRKCEARPGALRDGADPPGPRQDSAAAKRARAVMRLAGGGTGRDDLRVRGEILGPSAEGAAAFRGDLPTLGCCAKVGPRMPTWAPRRGARCEVAPTYFPGITIRGTLVVLPLCVVHHGKFERSDDQAELARDWAP
jgi:hypothetical protein